MTVNRFPAKLLAAILPLSALLIVVATLIYVPERQTPSQNPRVEFTPASDLDPDPPNTPERVPQANVPPAKVNNQASAKRVEESPAKTEPERPVPPEKPKEKGSFLAGTKILSKPDEKPEPRPEPKPEPPIVKVSVPPQAQIADAEKLIKEVYKADYARKKPGDLLALAAKLIEEGGKTNDNPAAQYVLFRDTIELACRAGDLMLAMRAVDELEAHFKLDALELKISTLANASQAQSLPAPMRMIIDSCLALVDDQVDANNYPAATRLLGIAETAAKKAGNTPLVIRVQAVNKEVTEIAREYETAKEAANVLAVRPADAEANLKVGKFIALRKGNWGNGLPLLARSNDDALKSTAAKDLANPTDAAEQVSVGDAWWNLAEAERGVAKGQMLLRAKHWYEQARPELAGFNLTRVDKRLKDIDVIVRKEMPSADKPALEGGSLTFERLVSTGVALFRQANYAKAADSFTEALKIRPNNPKVLIYLREARYHQYMSAGVNLANNNLLDDALRSVQQALEVKPNDPAALNAQNQLQQALQGGGATGKGKGKGKGF
jgi:tetratricopeptide (TPR) repeat protein